MRANPVLNAREEAIPDSARTLHFVSVPVFGIRLFSFILFVVVRRRRRRTHATVYTDSALQSRTVCWKNVLRQVYRRNCNGILGETSGWVSEASSGSSESTCWKYWRRYRRIRRASSEIRAGREGHASNAEEPATTDLYSARSVLFRQNDVIRSTPEALTSTLKMPLG